MKQSYTQQIDEGKGCSMEPEPLHYLTYPNRHASTQQGKQSQQKQTCAPAYSLLKQHLNELNETKFRFGDDHPTVVELLNRVGLFYHHVCDNQDESLKFHQEALRVLRLQMDHSEFCEKQERNESTLRETAITLTDIGNVQSKNSFHDDALAAYDEALLMFRKLRMDDEHHLIDAVLRGIDRLETAGSQRF
mmetsp:Transcript_25661/g.37782  ORF Transcript_25661/g.37782 Transcript_25661/m.37782 type:complete len:191 (+) Transcript_25661:84-656(+)